MNQTTNYKLPTTNPDEFHSSRILDSDYIENARQSRHGKYHRDYQPVIGLEVHVELSTKSKMFCRCSADYFGKEPNTHTCPVCLGLPGALPYVNKQAIEDCIKIGLALNCTVAEKSLRFSQSEKGKVLQASATISSERERSRSLFERKNYFYPDLPKGYQISQYRWPLCINGKLRLENGEWIRINRVHQEEDTGKLSHLVARPGHAPGVTLIDFNRSGVPLVEIVTEPDFTDVASVRDYAKQLQQLFRYLEVSNADMERGDMRLEANISVRPEGTEGLPNYRVELKNINSFRFMVAAIEYEIKRQIAKLKKGEKLTQETRGWDEDKKCTYLQRSKEEAHDYRYFPEPDIPVISLQSSAISLQQIKDKIPELPWDKQKRFVSEFKLTEAQAKILTETKELAEFFEEAVGYGKKHGVSAKEVANYLVNRKPDINSVLPTQIIEQLKGKKVGVIEDSQELEKLAQEVITENPTAVGDFVKGKQAALQALIGAVMKKSFGKADPVKAKAILEDLLKEKP